MPKIKGHPELSPWPPDWGGSFSGGDEMAIGEVGTVRDVNIRTSHPDKRQFLSIAMEFKTNRFLGVVQSKDEKTLKAVHDKIKANVGKSVAEIGQLEV